MKRPACEFNPELHEYRIDSRPVPHVTGVLRDIIPGWSASDWHLQRGRAVHACAAMVCRGQEFTHDPRIEGQIAACRKFLREVKPGILDIEMPVYSYKTQSAGTLDLTCSALGHSILLVDWKASFNDADPYQLAGYAVNYEETTGKPIRWGVNVRLGEDGRYQMGVLHDLRLYKQGWLSLLTAFGIRRKCGIKETEEAE